MKTEKKLNQFINQAMIYTREILNFLITLRKITRRLFGAPSFPETSRPWGNHSSANVTIFWNMAKGIRLSRRNFSESMELSSLKSPWSRTLTQVLAPRTVRRLRLRFRFLKTAGSLPFWERLSAWGKPKITGSKHPIAEQARAKMSPRCNRSDMAQRLHDDMVLRGS